MGKIIKLDERKKEKSKLIVFSEIEKRALSNIEKDLLLFGEKEYINNRGRIYDLVFYAVSGIKPNKINEITSLAIPVLQKDKHSQDDSYLDMMKLFSENKHLTRFVVSDKKNLIFYDLKPLKGGQEIESIGGYSTVEEKEFFDYIAQPKTEDISTHSNIVTKYLGAQEDCKLFSISMELQEKIPTSKVKEINTYEARREALEDLGYELFDFDLWDAWLFLEESTAERLIRDFFIPWYVPSLQNQVKTFSARCLGEVQIKFEDFNRLFVFLHLQNNHVYKNKVWVIVDGGNEEKQIIEKMKNRYTKVGWKKTQFSQFSEHDFESYYPSKFKEEVESILSIENKTDKKQKKKELFEKVIKWIDENKETAKKEFGNSAKEVIEKLKEIQICLK